MNPYVGHQNPLKEGQELFRKGLLSEAVLSLEAEVIKSLENAEGWRLLGITHAENDDDQQVRRRPVGFMLKVGQGILVLILDQTIMRRMMGLKVNPMEIRGVRTQNLRPWRILRVLQEEGWRL